MSHRQSLLARRPLGRVLRLFFVAALLVVGAGTAPAGPTRAEEPVPGSGVSPEGLLNADGTLDLSTGFEGTLDLRGWEVTLDGERGPVLEPASVSAASDPAWGALPNQGLNGTVYALAAMGDDVYVGGTFTQTVDGAVSDLGNIARYDTANDTWHALPKKGLSDAVRALAVVGSDLYVGGWFTQTGDGTVTDLGYIARYDTTGGTWHALAKQGLSWYVHALAVVGDDLYVGGYFTQSGDGTLPNLGYIVRYDTAGGTWHALPNEGLNSNVWTLTAVGSDLYVGGAFTATGDGAATGLSRIARYGTTGNAWHALPNQGLNGYVYALAAVGGDLYVGGGFTASGDMTVSDLNRIAHYDTTGGGTWHALPREGLNDWVFALVAAGDDLYVGGAFTATGDGTLTNLNRIARYDTAVLTWNALPSQGLDNAVYALAAADDDLYVGGNFAQSGDGTVTDLGSVARYNTTGDTWRALSNGGLNSSVLTLAVVGDDLYVGGGFSRTHDGAVTGLWYIARYDTTDATWHALPNQGLSSTVEALVVVGDDLYVGGRFAQTGDGTLTNLGRIARYDTAGGAWHALPNWGLNNHVYVLAAVGDDLYVGGDFTATGDGTVTGLNHIARYDTASGTWHALPNQGLGGMVRALAAVDSDLYVGGNFTASGDGTLLDLGYIARYDTLGSAWHTLPRQGVNHMVQALAAAGSDLYVGGNLTASGDGTVTNLGYIARYDTTDGTWHALPRQGLNHVVLALAAVDSDLYVGGGFSQAGDGVVTNLGRIVRYDTTGGTWHALPNQGLSDQVEALAAMGDDLYVGGYFAQTGDGAVTGLGGIARYSLHRHWVYLPLVIRQ